MEGTEKKEGALGQSRRNGRKRGKREKAEMLQGKKNKKEGRIDRRKRKMELG